MCISLSFIYTHFACSMELSFCVDMLHIYYHGLPRYFHCASTVALPSQLLGTVYARLAPDSYVTAPLLSTRINLYSKLVPAGKLTVVDHSGLDDVYLAADNAGADAVSQFPNCAIEPAILIVWPTEVVVLELKVTATVETSVAHPVAEALGLALVVDVEVGAMLDAGGLGVEPPPPPPILMSAQVR